MHLPPILLLASPIIQWESPRLLPWAVALACALAFAVVWFYPVQVRSVRRPWRWVIPGLRVTALAALALALARPVATQVDTVGQGGTVAILVDRSGSMDVADTERDPADLVALADSLGLLPVGGRGGATTRPARGNGPPPPTLAQLSDTFRQLQSAAQQAYRAQGDLDYSRVSGQGIEAAQARLNESASRVDSLGKSLAQLAQAALPGPAEPVLRQQLKALGRLPVPDARGTWVSGARHRIEDAERELSSFQRSSDARLFESNMEVRDACAALKAHTRFQLACAALLRPVGGLVARLGEKTPIKGFAFADDLSPLGPLSPNPSASLAASESSGFDDDPTNPPAAANAAPLPVAPDGGGTDLAGAVTAALGRLDPRTVRAVVLFSDGREVSADANHGVAPAASGVPVFTVAVAPAASPRDISFGGVQLPRSAFVGETIPIRATLRATGFTPEAPDVRLSLNGVEVARGRPPGHAPRDGATVAEFSLKLDQPGAQQITLSIPAVPDEATARNNSVERWVKVLPEKIRVAAYAAAPGWDFQFLRSALSRTPWVHLEAGVLDPDHPKLPLTPQQILEQDVLVLDDVPAEALDADQWDAVYNKLVKERGGSVVLVAGSDNAIQGYENQIAASSLLPFDPARVKPAWKIWPGEKPNFRVVPASGWEKSDFGTMLRLDNSDAANRRWQELPALFRVMPVPVGLLRANARPLLVLAESASSAGDTQGVVAVLTEARPGLGRSLLLGTDETWRWRLGTGERFQDRFWVQLVRYAAEEPYAARKGAVALDVDAVAVTHGEPVRVRARLYDAALQSVAAASADAMRLEIKSKDQVRTLPLTQAAIGSGRWEAVVSGLPVGDYQIRLLTPPVPPAAASGPDDTPGALEVPLHVVGQMEAELRNLSGDPDRLRRLAESTGGEMLRLDEIASLPDRLANLGEAHPRVSRLPLWDSPYLLLFVVACLAAEWALRKRFGLA